MLSHLKTGYRVTYLRNQLPFFIFATTLCCAYHFLFYIFRQTTSTGKCCSWLNSTVMSVGWSSSSHNPLNVVDSVHCIAGRSNANMSWIFLGIPPGDHLEICSVIFVDNLPGFKVAVLFKVNIEP